MLLIEILFLGHRCMVVIARMGAFTTFIIVLLCVVHDIVGIVLALHIEE